MLSLESSRKKDVIPVSYFEKKNCLHYDELADKTRFSIANVCQGKLSQDGSCSIDKGYFPNDPEKNLEGARCEAGLTLAGAVKAIHAHDQVTAGHRADKSFYRQGESAREWPRSR